jgi:hypothetical protein
MLRIASDAKVLPIVIDHVGAPLDLGYSSRFASPAIRHCANVRDKGCVFPGCTVPPERCESHHVKPWIGRASSQRPRGKTKLTNIALLCPFHHHIFEKWGRRLYLSSNRPWWIPPKTRDPDQRPIRNTANHPPTQFSVGPWERDRN